MLRRNLLTAGLTTVGLLLYASCGSESPTGSDSSSSITAPVVREPATGSSVSTPNPTLTVANASGSAGLQYRFEVASDGNFATIVASVDNVPEGGTGTTSWTVTPDLVSGDTYYWRARAASGGAQGPYSSAASFDVAAGFKTNTPTNLVYVFDPLTNGMSVGEVGGGEFRQGGWMATDALSYIRYEIPTTPNGFVEFQVTNLRNPNPHSDKRALMIMWDPTKGDYTENPFRVHLAKYDTRTVDRWHMRLRFISNGQETNTGIDFYQWDPTHVYQFRMEWGAFPQIVSSQRVQVFMDGREILVRNYDPLYRPSTHWIELGMAPRAESLEQAIYSNVRIGVRQP